jgi:murein DD-endopeptidase MepM/ murein hydrolase activator NlpD
LLTRLSLPKLAVAVLLLAALAGLGVAAGDPPTPVRPVVPLPPAYAVGIAFDTLFLGGYAAGSFHEATHLLASELSPAEREMVGQHLDRVFAGVLEEGGLGRTGRLRVAYERARRPDGSTRSIRLLAAEAAVAGRLHAAYFFESDGEPGYFDPFGRSLDPGAWRGPLEHARVSSAFGSRRMHPILNRVLPHSGVDYAAPLGTPVRAAGDGVVEAAGSRGGYGTLVEIQHPTGYSTRYAHLSRIAAGVGAGRFVRQGEVIGYVGMTGLATGPHLHFELRRHGRAVDPVPVLAAGGLNRELGSAPGWPQEAARLSLLLARAPTVLQADRGAR